MIISLLRFQCKSQDTYIDHARDTTVLAKQNLKKILLKNNLRTFFFKCIKNDRLMCRIFLDFSIKNVCQKKNGEIKYKWTKS